MVLRAWIVGIFCLVSTVASAAPPLIPDDVMHSVRERVDEGLNAGIVVGIVNKDGTAFYTYGTTELGGGKKVTQKTIYEIGSITMVFTAALLAQAVEDGAMKLDDPLGKYLPADVKAPADGYGKITLRQLATHTSGLPLQPTNLMPKDEDDPYADYDKKALFEYLNEYWTDEESGKDLSYSDLAFGLLGLLLEEKTNTPYEKLVIQRISKPLNLEDTRITLSKKQLARFAQPYEGTVLAKPQHFDCLGGCGALRSTAHDMLKFVAAAAGIEDTPLRKPFDAMLKNPIQTTNRMIKTALGWCIINTYGDDIYLKNAITGGSTSFCGFRRDLKIGVVVLTNSKIDAHDIGVHLLENRHPLRSVPRSVSVNRKILERYVGWYEMPTSQSLFHITLDGDKLTAKRDSQDACHIYPESQTSFFYRTLNAKITFTLDSAGNVINLTWHKGGTHRPAVKMEPDFDPPPERSEIRIDPKILDDYVGTYEVALGGEITIRKVGTAIWVEATGMARCRVFPFVKDRFFCKAIRAEIAFDRDKNGRVHQLVVHQDGAEVPAVRID